MDGTALSERDRRRDFRLYWLAGAADQLGSRASALVFPLLVLGAGGTPVQAGVVGSVALGANLVTGPVAGVYADRWPRKPIMVWAAVVAGIALSTVFAAAALDRVSLGHLLAVALVEGVTSAFYTAAGSGTVRRLVPPDDYPRAVSRLEARDHGVRIVGPSLGGALYQLARWVPFLLDAVSYLVAAACVRAMRSDLTPEPAGDRASFLGELRTGWGYVWSHAFLRFVTLWAACINLVFGALTYHAVLAFRLDGASPVAIGLILTVASGGGLAGALLAPRLVRVAGPARLVVGASWLMAVLVVALAFADRTWLYGLLLGSVFLVCPALAVVFQSRAIAVTPDYLQSRVGTAMGTVGEGIAVLAPILAGVTVARFGPLSLALGFGVVLALVAVVTTVTIRDLLGAPSTETVHV